MEVLMEEERFVSLKELSAELGLSYDYLRIQSKKKGWGSLKSGNKRLVAFVDAAKAYPELVLNRTSLHGNNRFPYKNDAGKHSVGDEKEVGFNDKDVVLSEILQKLASINGLKEQLEAANNSNETLKRNVRDMRKEFKDQQDHLEGVIKKMDRKQGRSRRLELYFTVGMLLCMLVGCYYAATRFIGFLG